MHRSWWWKRPLDFVLSALMLTLASPLLLGVMFAVWLQDRHSPLFKAKRVGRGGGDFTMAKIRSMTVNANRTGVNSTSSTDSRITAIGRFIRRYKIDELSQFMNVLLGSMSVVGPRPQTRAWGVDLYTAEEMRLLELRPGITDLASIVFSDEGEILVGAAHPDERYNQVIRPWKSRLALLYIDHASLTLDLRIIWLTVLAVVSKPRALRGVTRVLERLGAERELVAVCRREGAVPEGPPPGAQDVFRVGDSGAATFR